MLMLKSDIQMLIIKDYMRIMERRRRRSGDDE
jgi:hypothetical protein